MTGLREKPVGDSGEIISIGFRPSDLTKDIIEPFYNYSHRHLLGSAVVRLVTRRTLDTRHINLHREEELKRELRTRLGGRAIPIRFAKIGFLQINQKPKALEMRYGANMPYVDETSLLYDEFKELLDIDINSSLQMSWQIPMAQLEQSREKLLKAKDNLVAISKYPDAIMSVSHPELRK